MNVPTDSFMKALFFGHINEKILFPFPEMPKETGDTVRMFLDSFEKFVKDKVRSKEWDEAGEMPKEIIADLSAMGLMGLAVSEELGGMGLPQIAYARVFEELCANDASIAVTVGAHQSIGYKALLLFGTDEQKKKYLPRLAAGELVACFCLTEPTSGSDAASIQTKAVLSPDGKHYILNGSKLWITNGGIATFFSIFAKVEVEEKGQKKEKITCFILEGPTPGLSVGPAEHKHGLRASWTNAVYFENVKIPVENVVGQVGYGFKVAMSVLNHGRMGLAAGCVGGTKRMIQASVQHANQRVQFKKTLGEFGIVQEKIARMVMNCYVAESMVIMTTALIDRKEFDYSLESAIAKVFASEVVWEAADENVQIWAGNGYMKEYPYERWMRDSRINRIFEGTNEILRAFVALAGFQGPGEEMAELTQAIKDPLKGLGLVGGVAGRVIMQNTVGQTMNLPHPALKNMAGSLEDFSVQLANQVQILLLRHGKKIAERQFAQKRIADVAIDLYGMSCVISRVTSSIQKAGNDAEKCQMEMAIASAFFHKAKYRIIGNFKAIDKNEDDHMKYIAKTVLEGGRYPFDVLT